MTKFLHTQKTKIMDEKGRPVILKGVNVGGWLMMEAYILHAPNLPERYFKGNFVKVCGAEALYQFEEDFRNTFIQEKDFANIAKMGFNCVRVPFHYRLIETANGKYDQHGLSYLDRVIGWGRKYGVYIILDLHAAHGAQNHDWHSDSYGKAELWTNEQYQKKTYALWEFLADHFKDETIVAGYDILNEAVIDDVAKLNKFYKGLIKTIRSVDKNHILFVEGNRWGQDLEPLEEFEDDNHVLSIHYYMPLEFTFNLIPFLKYPLKTMNKGVIRKLLKRYERISKKRSVPVYLGEFGVNDREGVYAEHKWVKDVLESCREFGFHWTYWTYKAIKNSFFPDGIFSYRPNPPWVNRAGPFQGWETYHLHWAAQRKEIVDSWQTKNFTPNKHIVDILKNAARTHK